MLIWSPTLPINLHEAASIILHCLQVFILWQGHHIALPIHIRECSVVILRGRHFCHCCHIHSAELAVIYSLSQRENAGEIIIITITTTIYHQVVCTKFEHCLQGEPLLFQLYLHFAAQPSQGVSTRPIIMNQLTLHLNQLISTYV